MTNIEYFYKKEKLKEEVIALAEKIKERLELDEEADDIAERIYAAIFESQDEAPAFKINQDEAPAFKIYQDDQLAILGVMDAYGIYADLTPVILECLSALLENPNTEIFDMFDEINQKTNFTSGSKLLYYAKGARQ